MGWGSGDADPPPLTLPSPGCSLFTRGCRASPAQEASLGSYVPSDQGRKEAASTRSWTPSPQVRGRGGPSPGFPTADPASSTPWTEPARARSAGGAGGPRPHRAGRRAGSEARAHRPSPRTPATSPVTHTHPTPTHRRRRCQLHTKTQRGEADPRQATPQPQPETWRTTLVSWRPAPSKPRTREPPPASRCRRPRVGTFCPHPAPQCLPDSKFTDPVKHSRDQEPSIQPPTPVFKTNSHEPWLANPDSNSKINPGRLKKKWQRHWGFSRVETLLAVSPRHQKPCGRPGTARKNSLHRVGFWASQIFPHGSPPPQGESATDPRPCTQLSFGPEPKDIAPPFLKPFLAINQAVQNPSSQAHNTRIIINAVFLAWLV
ncbi:uncharacterized protein [Oryctolagus cuniculus]|uniref:uncharacterized protein n=1 Tax=Oryctolagus cuniculus TaxID=9986 RepID=UPI003878F71C